MTKSKNQEENKSCLVCNKKLTKAQKKFCCDSHGWHYNYITHLDEWKDRDKIRYARDRPKVLKRSRKFSKKRYEENKEEIAKIHLEYANKRYKEDEGYRIRKQLGSALGYVIKRYIKTGKVMNPLKKYSIDWEGIIKVLSPIPKDRHLYHVDHIVPLYKFDLTNIELIQAAFSPENHRWLLAKENQGRLRS